MPHGANAQTTHGTDADSPRSESFTQSVVKLECGGNCMVGRSDGATVNCMHVVLGRAELPRGRERPVVPRILDTSKGWNRSRIEGVE